ncbi:MAG: N-acetylmuramoyl-L-alanine amidase CwlD, partial [Thermoactinomyces sp.]
MIDAGHGGPDGGAVSQQGLVEKDVTLRIAHYLQDYLHGAGALVFLTRENDTDLANPNTKRLRLRKAEDLMRRVYLIKEKNVDAFISIHLNAIPSPRWSGAQTFYNPVREDNKRLATFIQAELIRNLENTNRLAKQKGDVYILKHSPVPTALVEVGFLSNPDEAKLLATETYQKKVAASIYLGLIRFYTGKEPPPLFDK